MWSMKFLAKKVLTCQKRQKQAQILPVLRNVQILSITPIHTISQNIWNQKLITKWKILQTCKPDSLLSGFKYNFFPICLF